MYEKAPFTFGQKLRASRLGFEWSADHRCFLRMSDGPNEGVRVDVAAPDALPKLPSNSPHRCWWDSPDILRAVPALEQLRQSGETPTGFTTWILDENGARVP
jgi:hypothetical protein